MFEFIFSKEWSLKYYSITKFNFFSFEIIHIFTYIYYFLYIIEGNLCISFSFGQFIHKISIIKFQVVCNVKMKYGLNKINIKLFTQ